MTITKSFTSATLALMLSTTLATASDLNFNRIASFKTPDNTAAGEDRNRETSPEIIAATADGMKLVYTDSPLGVLGMIDISNPANPKPLGNIKLGGEPTSVAIAQGNAFVGINTSKSFTSPSGQLKTFDINARFSNWAVWSSSFPFFVGSLSLIRVTLLFAVWLMPDGIAARMCRIDCGEPCSETRFQSCAAVIFGFIHEPRPVRTTPFRCVGRLDHALPSITPERNSVPSIHIL